MDLSDDHSSLMPMLTLTVGNTEIKPVHTPDYFSQDDSDGSNADSDPNRFNAYLNRGSELWTHWSWLGGQGKMSLMRCNYCLVNKQLKNAPKCRRHLIKCPKTPEIVRRYFEKKEVEATRVSALMRELRSKEIKFPRNSEPHHKPQSESHHKLPVPTANDLKHLQLKQHNQVSINNVIVKKEQQQHSPADMSLSKMHMKPEPVDMIKSSYTSMPNNKSSKHEVSPMTVPNHGSRNENHLNMNELTFIYQQIISTMTASSPETMDLSKPHSKGAYNGNGMLVSSKLKRQKLSPPHDAPNGGGGLGNLSTTNKENKEQHNTVLNGANNSTVVINLDDVNAFDESMFFNPLNQNGISTPINGSRKKKRPDSSAINGSNGHSNGRHEKNRGNGFHADFSNFNSSDLEIVHDDLNDLLASALISAGMDFDFIANPYFQKFIAQLVSLSGTNKNYRLPSADKLSTVNLTNLVRKFDYETAKIFSECDSIVVSFDWNNHKNEALSCTGKRNLDVNLLISTSNYYSQLFFKTIPSLGDSTSVAVAEENLKSFNNQIDSLVDKIGSDRINAVILPHDEGRLSSELICSYLSACHSHIVPLGNSYQLFDRLLCDICKIPSFHKLLAQCVGLFKDLAFNFAQFKEDNENHWKRVIESDSMKICKHLLKQSPSSAKNYWVSLNLILCWFIVARESIIKLFHKLADEDNDDDDDDDGSGSSKNALTSLLDKFNIDADQIDHFFGKISVLFNFLTPFITAIHLIENESSVISDIVKIYFDVKLATNNGTFFDGVGLLCDKLERQSIDCILHKYLQEQNFSRFFFLAYYLDPRFLADKRIEENEELISQVYDTLFSYANALGCVSKEDEDREQLVDSLDQFRNGDKLYGTQLLKCPKSPTKFWKHLRRFPASAKLAYCATRLLSISTRSMLLAAPPSDKCTSSLQRRLLTLNDLEVDTKATEKILPVKSYLMSHCEQIPNFDEEDKHEVDGKPDSSTNGVEASSGSDSISTIISNVITSLDQYSQTIAQPFTSTDLSTLIQTST